MLIGFKTEYLENPLLQVWFKSVVCLALIPITTVETEFQNLKYKIKFEIFANEHIGIFQCINPLFFETHNPHNKNT